LLTGSLIILIKSNGDLVMTTDYETEEQTLIPAESTAESTESVDRDESQLKEDGTEEELFFWSEPGVCG